MARAKANLVSVEAPPLPGQAPTRRAQKQAKQARQAAQRQRQPQSRPAPRAYERRYRQTIRKVDLWTVLKISICFYLTALIVVIVSGIVLWWISSALGIIGNIENFVGDLIKSEDFEFLSWQVLHASTLLGLVFVVLMVLITVLAAAFYNLFSELLGGIEVTVVEEESPRRY